MKTQFFRTLEAFPPFLMRALARSRGHCGLLVPDAIVSERGGLPMWQVRQLSRKSSWEGVGVGDADRFMIGCGVKEFRYLALQFRTELKLNKPFAYLDPKRYRTLLKRLEQLPESHPFFQR